MGLLKAVIFDLDDTLYPEIQYVQSGFSAVSIMLMSVLNCPSAEINKAIMEMFLSDRKQVFNRYLHASDAFSETLLNECIKCYQNHMPQLAFFPDALALLDRVKQSGLLLGLLTDGRPEGQWHKIRELDLETMMNAIVVTDELGGIAARKPSELGYREICCRLGIAPDESVYIGDNLSKDFITARKMGMKTVCCKHDTDLYQLEAPSEDYEADFNVGAISEIWDAIVELKSR